MILIMLFFEFFIIGLLLFGGGLAAIPFLHQLAERTGWYTVEQLMDMLAVSEATPGPIGINMATYAGFSIYGIPGSLAATFGLVLPSVIIALIVARLLVKFKDNSIVKSAFYSLRPASLALIAAAGTSVLRLSLLRFDLWQESGSLFDLFELKAILLAVILFILVSLFKKAHPIVFLTGSAAAGITFGL